MVASRVIDRIALKVAAPKKMARSRSTRRDERTGTRQRPQRREPSATRWWRGEKPLYTYQEEMGRGAQCVAKRNSKSTGRIYLNFNLISPREAGYTVNNLANNF